ncbi:CoA-binding protein [Marinobacter salinexigens]|uniref:CoA-binding protein n=1 Tax=Marinobacter salinexigens TaxID=2919747 RepID=A0A5B0VDM0_9GAMM|nr:CoA-binding protein [Marinobacter salinexigens]KAA1172760.1 CoA-binding protein [Marinobacter salinexigens]
MVSNSPDQIRSVLERIRTIALVGASEKPNRPSHEVMEYMQHRGYRVIPVNPRLAGKELLGETVYSSLKELPEAVDMAELFVAPERTDDIINEAIEMAIPVVWMQIGVINEAGAARAEAAGLSVVMDRCPKQEIPRLGIQSPTGKG